MGAICYGQITQKHLSESQAEVEEEDGWTAVAAVVCCGFAGRLRGKREGKTEDAITNVKVSNSERLREYTNL